MHPKDLACYSGWHLLIRQLLYMGVGLGDPWNPLQTYESAIHINISLIISLIPVMRGPTVPHVKKTRAVTQTGKAQRKLIRNLVGVAYRRKLSKKRKAYVRLWIKLEGNKYI